MWWPRLRRAIPGITITTDIIVGFPGETEEDFEETLDLVAEVRFDNAFTFWYSPRAGTVGALWEERQGVPEAVKKERLYRLNELQNRISAEINRTWVGRTEEVLIEGPSKKDPRSSARAPRQQDRPAARDEALAGRFATVRITGSTSFWLEGEILAVEDRPGNRTRCWGVRIVDLLHTARELAEALLASEPFAAYRGGGDRVPQR